MGGNALSEPSIRLTASQYHNLSQEIENAWACSGFRNRRHVIVPAYFKKPTFGDMDILVDNSGNYDPTLIARTLGATEIVEDPLSRNPILSFGLPRDGGTFQVDLMSVSPEAFDWAHCYYAFNDLGNLLGRIARSLGFRFGHRGLLLKLISHDNHALDIGEIVLTTNWGLALRFLGYDPSAYGIGYNGGFQTLEDVFRFVISSQYVSQDAFLFENMNNAQRLRDKKRKTYNSFLKWVTGTNCPKQLLESGPYGTPEHAAFRQAQLQRAFAAFPGTEGMYHLLHDRSKRRKIVKTIFTPDYVSGITGLKQKELGELMAKVRGGFANEDAFQDFILSSSAVEIDDFIRRCQAA